MVLALQAIPAALYHDRYVADADAVLPHYIPDQQRAHTPLSHVFLPGIFRVRAAKVTTGLLNFARQERYEFVELDLNQSILQALDLVVYQLQSKGIRLVRHFADDLPRFVGSLEHLKSVWINLLVNAGDAVKDRPENSEIVITTRLSPNGEQIQVLVQDNGVGMSEAQQAHIFEPFYTTKDPGKGTGLGLATCFRIIEQHGGEIDVISQPGEGTTFIILLPTKEPRSENI
ncbi:MAG: ATP-binding protein [Candidatus Promineifilaceae bacterium]